MRVGHAECHSIGCTVFIYMRGALLTVLSFGQISVVHGGHHYISSQFDCRVVFEVFKNDVSLFSGITLLEPEVEAVICVKQIVQLPYNANPNLNLSLKHPFTPISMTIHTCDRGMRDIQPQ